MLRSVFILAHPRKLHWQVSKLGQLVTVHYVIINNHKPNGHNTAGIFDRQGQTAICHSSEDWLLHYMDEEVEHNWWRKAMLQELGTILRLTLN